LVLSLSCPVFFKLTSAFRKDPAMEEALCTFCFPRFADCCGVTKHAFPNSKEVL